MRDVDAAAALRAYLQPFDFTAEIDRECATFVPDTMEKQIAEFVSWLAPKAAKLSAPAAVPSSALPVSVKANAAESLASPPMSRLCYLEEPASQGKTCLLSVLSRRFRDDIVGVHFCKFSEPAQNEPARIVKSLAWQIAERIPEYKAELMRILPSVKLAQSQSAMSLSTLDVWTRLLVEPLTAVSSTVASRLGGRKCVLLLDAADEVSDPLLNHLMALVGACLPLLPPWIGLVLSVPCHDYDSRYNVCNPCFLHFDEVNVEECGMIVRHHLRARGLSAMRIAGKDGAVTAVQFDVARTLLPCLQR